MQLYICKTIPENSFLVPTESRLYPPHQSQNNYDQQNQSQPASWVIPPAAAVRPRRQSADQQQNQDDNQNGEHLLAPPL